MRDGGGVFISESFFPSTGVAGEANSFAFDLPLPEGPMSWETGIQVIVDARIVAPPPPPVILYTSTFANSILHPSSNLVSLSFDTPVVPADPPGTYPATFDDNRPTGQISHYKFDVFRRVFAPYSNAQVGQANHGYASPPPYNVTVQHPPTTRPVNLPVLAGQQFFWLRPRVTYKNSVGTSLGRYDVAPKSPNLFVETTAP